MNIAKRRKRFSRWIYVLTPLLALSISWTAAAAEPKVPETIYQWVQSSERMNYFFNKEEMRYAKSFANILDALRVVLRQEYKASAEEHEPHERRNKAEDVIERQESKIMYIKLCIVLYRLVGLYDIFAHLDLQADRLAAVADDLGLRCRTGSNENYLISPVSHGLCELYALADLKQIFYCNSSLNARVFRYDKHGIHIFNDPIRYRDIMAGIKK